MTNAVMMLRMMKVMIKRKKINVFETSTLVVIACVPSRAEMATSQSLELGWLSILAVLSPCLHFFSTMTSPFSRLLQLPNWHRDALDLLGHALSRSFLQSSQILCLCTGHHSQ